MRGVYPIAVLVERCPRRVERLRGPSQVTRHECDLGLGDDTPRSSHGLFRTECANRTPQERLRSHEIAQLRHRDTSKRESRRVVAQGHALQRAEGITRCKRARCSRNQRVHSNPATLVTLTIRYAAARVNLVINNPPSLI